MAEQILVRAFPTELERIGPRTITGRLVPYDTVTEVLDMTPDGKVDIYREGFRPGAFVRQSASPEPGVARRIRLVHSHEGGLGYLGPFKALREEADGLWGDAEVLRSRSNDVEDLLAAGVRELSVEFRLTGRDHTATDADGVRWRQHAHLDAVALEPKGAYTGAEVTAFRAEQDQARAEGHAADQVHDREAADAAREAAELAELEAAQLAADAAAKARRARWDELTGRLDHEKARQQVYVREYGIMLPPHNGLPIKAY